MYIYILYKNLDALRYTRKINSNNNQYFCRVYKLTYKHTYKHT